jgi:hypothetical protein
MIIRTVELSLSWEIGRPHGAGKARIEFKHLCRWQLTNGCSLIFVGANGVLELLPHAPDVTESMKSLFMFERLPCRNPNLDKACPFKAKY